MDTKPFSISRDDLEKLPPLEKSKALGAIRTIEGFQEENPLFYYNHPLLSEKPVHEKQLLFHEMSQRLRCFFGGNQSGKTTAGLVDDLVQVVSKESIPKHLQFLKKYEPPCYVRILTTDMVTLELTVYQKLRELVPKAELLGGSWAKAFNQQQRVLRFKNGSLIQFMTYKQDVSTMGGATLHRVHYDEEPPRDVFEENTLRVMRRGGDQIITMTPLQGLTWTYQEIWEQVAEVKANTIEADTAWATDWCGVVLVDMDDNPYLTEEDKAATLRGFSPEVIEARKRGKFIHFAGLIYGEFDSNIHVMRGPQPGTDDAVELINLNTNVVVGIDPGIRNRAAVIWAGLTHEDSMYVFDELYEQGRTIKELANLIKLINVKWGINPIYYVIDPASRNRNNQTGRSDQMEFSDHGIVTIAGQHPVEAGINRVKERLRSQRLKIFDNCFYTIKEFEKYRWKDSPRTDEDGAPRPVKTEDHLMDALRYLVMSRPYLPEEIIIRNESPLQRLMREDRERTLSSTPSSSEFGGGIFV